MTGMVYLIGAGPGDVKLITCLLYTSAFSLVVTAVLALFLRHVPQIVVASPSRLN